MSLQPLVVIGGGEHAAVVIDAVRAGSQFQVAGFSDPEGCETMVQRLGVTRLGDDNAALPVRAKDHVFILGVGGASRESLRGILVKRFAELELRYAVVVHPNAWVSKTASIGEGTVVMAGAVVHTGAKIGAHAIINTGAVIEHDVEVGDHVHVGPRAAIGGGTRIGSGCMIGLGALIRDHVEIGARTKVGMGAVVVNSLDADECVIGVPAKPMRR